MTDPSSLSPVEKLSHRRSDGKLHHALLFHGRDIEEVERQAHGLACEILGVEGASCEHADLFRLRPGGKMRIISVDKTRMLIGELNRSSNQGGAKVALLHEADRMKKAAANALLKTLEEPSPETYLFLLSSKPYSMLPTIRSRCLQVRVAEPKNQKQDPDWDNWLAAYRSWICLMLDREKLMRDRCSPVFAAYGLAERLISLIKDKANQECKSKLKELSKHLDDKEKDAIETGIRKGVRSLFLRKLSYATREIALQEKPGNLDRYGIKLARVISNLEKNSGLMEVNLKEEVALENFWLSSLRIWSSK